MKKWNPPKATMILLRTGPRMIRTHTIHSLLNASTFRIAGPILTLFGMGGITFHKKYIVLSKTLCNNSLPTRQAKLIFHEMVHVAQQRDMGWVKFMAQYICEWVKCGFSYKKMKKVGLELEAYTLADEFSRRGE